MKTVFVDATSRRVNWGKFMVGVFDQEELARKSAVDGQGMVWGRGWGPGHVLVLDLQTGEGAIFKMGGLAKADLEKHNIWVCVIFEAFLEWLYLQPDPMNLPPLVELEVPFAMQGYRRNGREDAMRSFAEDCYREYSAFASNADGCVSSDIDNRALALGITEKSS